MNEGVRGVDPDVEVSHERAKADAISVPEARDRKDDRTAGSSLAMRLAALNISTSLNDAYEYYRLVWPCQSLAMRKQALSAKPIEAGAEEGRRATERFLASEQARCGDIGAQQYSTAVAKLEQAAAGRVPGAAIEFLAAGPFGDPDALSTRPDDPLVQAWRAKAVDYLIEAAESGDVDSLSTLSVLNANGHAAEPDRRAALMYQVAYEQARRMAGRAAVNEPAATARMAAGLSAEDVEQATRQGKALAARCCTPR